MRQQGLSQKTALKGVLTRLESGLILPLMAAKTGGYWASEPISGQRGSAIFMTILFMSILTLIPVMMQMNRISSENTKLQTTSVMADNVALAGLNDGLRWFRKQPAQPVAKGGYMIPDWAFDPKAEDPYFDTLDAKTGLVKEYQMSEEYKQLDAQGNLVGTGKERLWARYQLKRQPSGSIDPQAVHDISGIRIPGATAGDGLVWQVESTGYVYRSTGAGALFNPVTHYILSQAHATAEIWRLSISQPADAALVVNNISKVQITGVSGINGLNKPGIAYYTYDNISDLNNFGAKVNGNPPIQTVYGVNSTAISVERTFGVSQSKLRELADVVSPEFYTNYANLNDMPLIYVTGNATFALADTYNTQIYKGTYFVDGDLTLDFNNVDSGFVIDFRTFIFVKGNFWIKGRATIRGAVAVTGEVWIDNNGTQIVRDPEVLNSATEMLGKYRINPATVRILSRGVK